MILMRLFRWVQIKTIIRIDYFWCY
jgi:hypothetical protein